MDIHSFFTRKRLGEEKSLKRREKKKKEKYKHESGLRSGHSGKKMREGVFKLNKKTRDGLKRRNEDVS